MIKKLVAILFLSTVAHGFNQVRYVQISTNTLSQQSGNANFQGATISTVSVTSATITNLSVTSAVTFSSETVTGPVAFTGATSTFTLLGPISTAAVAAVGTSGMSLHSKGSGVGTTWSYGGQVIQRSSFTITSSTASTSATYARTGLALVITPTLATSSITIIGTCNLSNSNPASFNTNATLERNAVNLAGSTGFWSCNNGQAATTGIQCSMPISYVDFPNSTSALTYEIYIKTSAGGTVTLDEAGVTCTLFAWEIGA